MMPDNGDLENREEELKRLVIQVQKKLQEDHNATVATVASLLQHQKALKGQAYAVRLKTLEAELEKGRQTLRAQEAEMCAVKKEIQPLTDDIETARRDLDRTLASKEMKQQQLTAIERLLEQQKNALAMKSGQHRSSKDALHSSFDQYCERLGLTLHVHSDGSNLVEFAFTRLVYGAVCLKLDHDTKRFEAVSCTPSLPQLNALLDALNSSTKGSADRLLQFLLRTRHEFQRLREHQ